MLSDKDKMEMLADAKDTKRRNAFRQARMLQESRKMSLKDYCAFVEQMRRIFPIQKKENGESAGKTFLL